MEAACSNSIHSNDDCEDTKPALTISPNPVVDVTVQSMPKFDSESELTGGCLESATVEEIHDVSEPKSCLRNRKNVQTNLTSETVTHILTSDEDNKNLSSITRSDDSGAHLTSGTCGEKEDDFGIQFNHGSDDCISETSAMTTGIQFDPSDHCCDSKTPSSTRSQPRVHEIGDYHNSDSSNSQAKNFEYEQIRRTPSEETLNKAGEGKRFNLFVDRTQGK